MTQNLLACWEQRIKRRITNRFFSIDCPSLQNERAETALFWLFKPAGSDRRSLTLALGYAKLIRNRSAVSYICKV